MMFSHLCHPLLGFVQDRAALTINGINAAKDASVPFLLVLSVPTAGQDTVFGRQFGEIEEAATSSGVPTTLLRLPLFTDNIWYGGPHPPLPAGGRPCHCHH